jgi:AcrR family transcriptional regulator
MREVAAAVGVTPANIYYHFKGKDELIRETLAHVFVDKTAPMTEILTSDRAADEKLEVFVTWFVRLLVDDRVFFRLLMREFIDGDVERLKDLSHSVLQRPFRLVSALVSEQAPAGDHFLAAVSMIGLVLGHVQLASLLPYLPGGRPEHADPDVVARHVFAVLRRAFQDTKKDK